MDKYLTQKKTETITEKAKNMIDKRNKMIETIKSEIREIEKELNKMDNKIYNNLPKIYIMGREVLYHIYGSKKNSTWIDYIIIKRSFFHFGRKKVFFKWNRCKRYNKTHDEKIDCYNKLNNYNNNLNYLNLENLTKLSKSIIIFKKWIIENINI